MKNQTIVGALLIIVGSILLVYQGFSFTREKKVIDIGPIEAHARTTETVPIPPIIGWIVTAAGVVVLVSGLRKSA